AYSFTSEFAPSSLKSVKNPRLFIILIDQTKKNLR
ncbi:MAG: hypothetical protein ACI976_002081, partial [Aureispira sp.]